MTFKEAAVLTAWGMVATGVGIFSAERMDLGPIACLVGALGLGKQGVDAYYRRGWSFKVTLLAIGAIGPLVGMIGRIAGIFPRIGAIDNR
jgi:hypothetical protein